MNEAINDNNGENFPIYNPRKTVVFLIERRGKGLWSMEKWVDGLGQVFSYRDLNKAAELGYNNEVDPYRGYRKQRKGGHLTLVKA